ncbi:hypothetical protein [Vibrio sp. MEBiC08052]|uniref:hypothetical protein n=1 Tax=Vibrio sp. MEBiC08052 TaxID=1761910 RepID=UPI000740D577|nr:hypothetical protein [Vibrio sp. MEBiC08052]
MKHQNDLEQLPEQEDLDWALVIDFLAQQLKLVEEKIKTLEIQKQRLTAQCHDCVSSLHGAVVILYSYRRTDPHHLPDHSLSRLLRTLTVSP